ncbi:hypothetical protein HDU93_001039 [Gonapodya sp. JEL0774]|nr:hypothetical protein HDU93_001039 [Gonapodya sp. JEL0774]
MTWVIMGMMAGMLLSRALSGAIATGTGRWEAPYWTLAGVQALLVAALWKWMPDLERKIGESEGTGYLKLLKSCVVGLAGAAAIPFAVMIGQVTDRVGTFQTILIGEALIALSWIIAATAGRTSLPSIFISGFLIELALQTQQVPNQKRVFLLDPAARTRSNSVYMLFAFAGSAAGSALGAQTFARWGWSGSAGLGVAAAGVSMVIWVLGGEDGEGNWWRQRLNLANRSHPK